jgi:phage tail-like protein
MFFRGFTPVQPSNRKFSIFNLFAAINRKDDADYSDTLFKVCAILEEPIKQSLSDLDEFRNAFDITVAPEKYIDRLLENLGNPFVWWDFTENEKRQLALILVDLYKLKGTESGVIAALRFFFDFSSVSVIYYWGTGWMLSIPTLTELGLTTVLNSSLRRDKYSFSVIIDRVLTDWERILLRRVVEVMKTAHTHLIYIREPSVPFIPDHWQLPWSELGINSLLH